MPTLFRIGRYRFFFYAHEGDPREPAHVHAESGDETAKFWLWPDVRLARNNGYDARALRRLRSLIEPRRADIEEKWNEFFG